MLRQVDKNKFDWQFWFAVGGLFVTIVSSYWAMRSGIDLANVEISHIKEDVREIKNDMKSMRNRFVSHGDIKGATIKNWGAP